MKTVREVLREKRIEKGIQQKWVAISLNISQSVASMYESGRLKIPVDLFIKWAKLFELELSDFCECGERKK